MKGALPQHFISQGGDTRSRTPSPTGRTTTTMGTMLNGVPKIVRRKGRIWIVGFVTALLLVQLMRTAPSSPYYSIRQHNTVTSTSTTTTTAAATTVYKTDGNVGGISGLLKPDAGVNGNGLKVVILNSPRYHFEVVLPLVHVFSHQEGVSKLELFATEHGSSRLGVRPLLHRQMPKRKDGTTRAKLNVREPKTLKQMGYTADVMVLTSCSRDLEDISGFEFWHPDDEGAPREIICLMHETEEWKDTETERRIMLEPWIEKGRLSAMVLSPHVRDYVIEKVEKEWKMAPVIEDAGSTGRAGIRVLQSFAPAFEDNELWDWKILNAKFPGPFASIPGKYEPYRRDYSKIFRHMLPLASSLRKHKSILRIAGFGESLPVIDPSISDLLEAHSGYEFPQYFSLLSKAMGIFPAFAHHKYLEDRASSTIATAVIAGVPLICSKEMVDKYSYLDETTAWVQREGEEEADAWVRVLEMGPQAMAEKKAKVRELRANLIAENKKMVGRFLEEAKGRIEVRASGVSTSGFVVDNNPNSINNSTEDVAMNLH